MNKKIIALMIIPIIGLALVLSTESDTQISDDAQNTSNLMPSDSLPVNDQKLETVNQECSGNAKCFVGTVTEVIDGNTLRVDEHAVRFSLASAPSLNAYGGIDSKSFMQTLCPVGSQILVDEDDGYPSEGPGRIIGVVHCNDMILNKELLDADMGYLNSRFCDSSEFAKNSWAQKHGC